MRSGETKDISCGVGRRFVVVVFRAQTGYYSSDSNS